MTTLIEGNYLINFYEVPKRDGNEIIYTDRDKGIAEHKNLVDNIVAYVKINETDNSYFKLELTPYTIKQLYKSITEIEQQEVPPQEVDY